LCGFVLFFTNGVLYAHLELRGERHIILKPLNQMKRKKKKKEEERSTYWSFW